MNLRFRARCLPVAAAATLLLGVGFALGGCGSTDCSFTATCGGGTALVDGGGDGPVIPMDCNLSLGPKDSMGCVVDSVGVFVSAKGRGGATGTMKDPLPTIAEGIALATSTNRPRVYVCEGTYAEAIKIGAALGVYGGLTCADNVWVAKDGVKPKVTPSVGPAIEVKSAKNVTIQDVEATGSAESGAGKSAIGALIVRSTVAMNGVLVSAGPGANGSPGNARSNYTAPAAVGSPNMAQTGGAGPMCMCLDNTFSQGGRGADGNGGNTTNGASNPPVGGDNVGGSRPSGCDPGGGGANGAPVSVGEPIAAPGVVVDSGWDTSKRAPPSPNGRPAQGGGGGGARTDAQMLAGAGGGCGGCGGAGGEAGGNGGASVGLLSFESSVTFSRGTISPSAGGVGGSGGAGQAGQGGAAGGDILSCDGGMGGEGSGGGGGPGGAGGDSIAIAWKLGTAPAINASTLSPGTPGGGGKGGDPGGGSGEQGLPGKQGNPGKPIEVFASP